MKTFVWSFCFPCRVNQTVLFKFDSNYEDVYLFSTRLSETHLMVK